MKLILGSGSPRRQELLGRLGLPFEVDPADVDEEVGPDETIISTVRRLAEVKAQTVAHRHPADLVIGADTVVALNGELMGKPADAGKARTMLQALSGKTHQVHTAVALVSHGARHRSSLLETTAVTFYPLEPEDIEYYVATDPPLDKAGAYGIQDWSGVFVQSIQGCYHNVMGFPLASFQRHLRATGLWGHIDRINNL